MSERSKESHSRCDVAKLEGSNPSLCIIFIFLINRRPSKTKKGVDYSERANECNCGMNKLCGAKYGLFMKVFLVAIQILIIL